MDEIHLTSRQVRDLIFLLSEAAEQLYRTEKVGPTFLANLCDQAALELADRINPPDGDAH